MWLPEVGVVEKVIRSSIVYTFLLVVFRLTGKRQVGHECIGQASTSGLESNMEAGPWHV